jgi:hypothetical protein
MLASRGIPLPLIVAMGEQSSRAASRVKVSFLRPVKQTAPPCGVHGGAAAIMRPWLRRHSRLGDPGGRTRPLYAEGAA